MSDTAAVQEFTQPAQTEEATTGDIVDQILETMNAQQPVAAQQDATAQQYNNYMQQLANMIPQFSPSCKSGIIFFLY